MTDSTCQWYVSIEQPECGKPAVVQVKVKTQVTQAMVYLCSDHKAQHDETFARIRNERKKQQQTQQETTHPRTA